MRKDSSIPMWVAVLASVGIINLTAVNVMPMVTNPDGRTAVPIVAAIASLIMIFIGAVAHTMDH